MDRPTMKHTGAPLVDRFGRNHTDLRLSVTDRCNIRCRYCMPSEGVRFRPREEILSFEQIERFVRVAASLGIRELRLTGGEPLMRKGIPQLIESLARVPGIEDLALTTNGILLAPLASKLRAAGLGRLNISLDTLDRQRYQQITLRDELPRVLEGIAKAREVGFDQIKLNALAIRGFTEDEVLPLARFARQEAIELRFIEYMPLLGTACGSFPMAGSSLAQTEIQQMAVPRSINPSQHENAAQRPVSNPCTPQASRHIEPARVFDGFDACQALPATEILDMLARHIGPLELVSPADSPAPAREYRFLDGGGRIGLICSMTQPFCAQCSRLRLTADGMVRNCLFSEQPWDARAILRGGGTDRDLAQLLRSAINAKRRVQGTEAGGMPDINRPMYQIGG